MGLFRQTVKVGNPAGGDFVEIDALVDTEALDSMFPASLLAELRLQPRRHFEYTVAGRAQNRVALWHCPNQHQRRYLALPGRLWAER